MQAVADSNLTQMAKLWGTSAGPAAKTNQPSDCEKRIAVMQAYLQQRVPPRYVRPPAAGDANRHAVQVEIRRQLCTWVVPFSVDQALGRNLDREPGGRHGGGKPRAALRPGTGPAATHQE